MGRLTRDFDAVEAALRTRDGARLSPAVQKGPFGRALRRFFETVRRAEAEIAQLRGELERGSEVSARRAAPSKRTSSGIAAVRDERGAR